MASLRQSLITKYDTIVNNEQNLETGKVWVYNEATVRTKFYNCWCWKSPGTGKAIIEAWGAGGSASRICCCGAGLPGNSGAYSKKTICVDANTNIRGCNGWSCGNSDVLCFRGCSEPTMLCWCVGASCTGCMCAEGGMGGTAFCSTGTSLFCCYGGNGFCTTKTLNENCGVVCNFGTARPFIACAYGGDVNCCGQFNCKSFFGCLPNCVCQFQQHIYVPPGLISTGGAWLTFNHEADGSWETWTGSGLGGFFTALDGASKNPTAGHPYSACWSGNRACGCYEAMGCIGFIPTGIGGVGTNACPDHRTAGYRGGQGAVRIKFIAG